MQLNLPILDRLAHSKNILIAGAGGGFDVFAGLPLYFTLRELGKRVHLANYSFCNLEIVRRLSAPEILLDGLVFGTRGPGRMPVYFPEGYLAEWFNTVHGEDVPVWMFANTGAAPLARGYQKLVEHLNIDAIILVDGGVDSLMRGDEAFPGSLIEDTVTLAAVESLDVPIKILSCLGFGTEVEEGLCHHHALENIAALAKMGAFQGTCSLTPQMEAFQLFEAASRYVWEQPNHLKSHISTRIIPAVHGEFGDFHMYESEDKPATIFVSPLMGLYWFFDANAVIERSYLVDVVRRTETIRDARNAFVQMRRLVNVRPQRSIPY